ncbi:MULTISPECIES: CC/Se motif family (seleno)protein [Solibacillus]|uniref:Fe-S oxidoreductase n=1 Tax=Solibacillus merdavium TaxID=2762218 RepID=A0ABR8XMJ8_9BACL|nr:CC/Se motif family (seleno)protein [Solibacillus merdavium]MBD8033167.1 Fe-S oxidoreductase [Solibacillus merdavium]
MHIELDANTKQWIQSKGKPVSVKMIQVTACCAPPVQECMTHFGKPRDLHNYAEFKIDNSAIFVEKYLLRHEKMILKLTGIGIFKTITARFS